MFAVIIIEYFASVVLIKLFSILCIMFTSYACVSTHSLHHGIKSVSQILQNHVVDLYCGAEHEQSNPLLKTFHTELVLFTEALKAVLL